MDDSLKQIIEETINEFFDGPTTPLGEGEAFDYLGTVDYDGVVYGEPVHRHTDRSHPVAWLQNPHRWKYSRERNAVIWTGEVDREVRKDIDAWLAKRGITNAKHYNYHFYESAINEGAFRIYNESLCPDLWDEYQHLDPRVRINLLRMAYDLYEKTKFKAPIVDVWLMGSIANYNWTPESDADVHIIIEFPKLEMPDETASKVAKSAGAQWNSEHNVFVKGHKVEINFQSAKAEKPHVTGIYSLVKDVWVRKPSLQPVAIDKVAIQEKYTEMKKYIEAALQSGSRDVMKDAKTHIDDFRQHGLDTGGELSGENIVFKLLRSRGLLKALKDAITKTYDQEMTVSEGSNNSPFKDLLPLLPKSITSKARIDGDKLWFHPGDAKTAFIAFVNGKYEFARVRGNTPDPVRVFDNIKDVAAYFNKSMWDTTEIGSIKPTVNEKQKKSQHFVVVGILNDEGHIVSKEEHTNKIQVSHEMLQNKNPDFRDYNTVKFWRYKTSNNTLYWNVDEGMIPPTDEQRSIVLQYLQSKYGATNVIEVSNMKAYMNYAHFINENLDLKTCDYIGGVVQGEVRAEPIEGGMSQSYQHNNFPGLFSGQNTTNWRYNRKKNQVLWNLETEPENITKVNDFLAKRGIVNPKHKAMYTYNESTDVDDSELYHKKLSDDERDALSNSYFSVGQESWGSENNSYCWIWDKAVGGVIAVKGGTHSMNFGPTKKDYTFSGWYDPEKDAFSVVFPDSEVRKLGGRRPTEDDIPHFLYKKLMSKFSPSNPKFLVFEVTQKDVKSHLPPPEHFKRDDSGEPRMDMFTLDHLKAMRDKAARSWDWARKNNQEQVPRAMELFIKYQTELKRRLNYINKPVTEERDPRYSANTDFLERRQEQMCEIAAFLKDTPGDSIIPWKTVPSTLLKKTWMIFGKYNKVNENDIDKIADQILTNIVRLYVSNEFAGHSTNYHMREEVFDNCGIDFTEKEWDKNTWRFENVSDFGMEPLMKIYNLIFNAETPEEKLYACDKALNVVHQRNDLASIFVEGGSSTLTQIATQGGYDAGYGHGDVNRMMRDIDEGYGAGIPEEDPLHKDGERWRIQFGARKTPKMPNESLKERYAEELMEILMKKYE